MKLVKLLYLVIFWVVTLTFGWRILDLPLKGILSSNLTLRAIAADRFLFFMCRKLQQD